MVVVKFGIIYCQWCLTTVCVPPRTLADSSLTVYGNIYKPCECQVPCGVYYRTRENDGAVWTEVEVDLDDWFEADNNRVERMDFVVNGGFP